MKRILSTFLKGRNVSQYFSNPILQRRLEAFRGSSSCYQFRGYTQRFSDDEDYMVENQEEFEEEEEEKERTFWTKFKRAMVWKRHLEAPDEEEIEIDPDDLPDPDAFEFRTGDYIFWVYLIIAGVIGLLFMKLQSTSRPFYMNYIPTIRRTLENLDNKIFFKIVQEKAWNRILSILENGIIEEKSSKDEENKDEEKFYYHKNFEKILKSIFGEDVKKRDLRLLNTNFVCKPTHIFYMLPIIERKKGFLKKMLQMTYYESRFDVFFPIIHQKTKVCCVVKICLKTKRNPNQRKKKNIVHPKIKIPLQLEQDLQQQQQQQQLHQQQEEELEYDDSIPEHQRTKDTLGDVDFDDDERLLELEKTLSEEEKQLSKKELKRYISLVEEEERNLREERKEMAKDLGIPTKKPIKKKRRGLFGGPSKKKKKDEDDEEGSTPRGPAEFKDIDVEIENISLVHVKKILNNYDAAFFNQLPLRLINEAMRFNWPYESETYEIKKIDPKELLLQQQKEEEEAISNDSSKKKKEKSEDVDEIILIKNNNISEKPKVISEKIPIFCHSGNVITGYIVPTEYEIKNLPDEN